MSIEPKSKIVRVAGPVVVAEGLSDVRMYDVVYVGQTQLLGEVIRLSANLATIQVYEDTGGLRVGEPVISSGSPFMVELGPGLLLGAAVHPQQHGERARVELAARAVDQ